MDTIEIIVLFFVQTDATCMDPTTYQLQYDSN